MKRILIVSLILVFVVNCNSDSYAQNNLEDYNRPIWPEPEPQEIQVMILGTYHFSNPGLDAINVNADDVRSAKRQEELRELADKLVQFDPEIVAVEWNYKDAEYIDSLYKNSSIDSLLKTKTNEVIQIGFRVAKMLNLETVNPIDFPMRLGNDSIGVLLQKYDRKFPHKIKYEDLDHEKIEQEKNRRLRNSTIVEYLRYLNTEEVHQINHYGMFRALRLGEDNNFGGPMMLAQWYDRNFRMVHNIYRAAKPETKRILLIVGAGHVSPIRHILDDAPMFCPISALLYLQ